MKFKKGYHYILLLATIVLTTVCGILIPKVNVNSDMTKYLPDGSPMKQGIEILSEEFGTSQLSGADVRVMFTDLEGYLREPVARKLQAFPEVDSVSYKIGGPEGTHTLYELSVPKSVDQKSLGFEIKQSFDRDMIVETSQDGATPPMIVLIIAGVLILLILILMSESWLEPLLFMLSVGMAVVINIGSNALLPSVSITTNYIVAILQLVLSLDYSIILMSRYRQEKQLGKEPAQAINSALRRAVPSILSSAMTTVVGLLMLCFMKLKIGTDMGVVLAKGVLCSLFCNFTVLPGLILLCDKWIYASAKKTLNLPTDRLSRFSVKWKLPLVVAFIAVFVAAYILHNRTEISFSTNGISRIDEVFPSKNTSVLLYDNADEDRIIELADSILTIDGVENVISYPTLLQKSYRAGDMISAIESLSEQSGMTPDDSGMLSEELFRIMYYMKHDGAEGLKISFPDIATFISTNCAENPLFADAIDDQMKEKLNLLGTFVEPEQPVEEEVQQTPAAETPTAPAATETPKTQEDSSAAAAVQEPAKEEYVAPVIVSAPDGISVIEFVKKLRPRLPEYHVSVLQSLIDTASLRKEMNVQEITDFVGSTPTQTRMVFSFSKNKSKTMTPLFYFHFLADDLFQRKALASMVSSAQKSELLLRMKFADCANVDARLSAAELASMCTEFGVPDISEQQVKDLMKPAPAAPATPAVPATPATPVAPAAPSTPADVPAVADSAAAPAVADSTVATAPVVETPKVAPKPKKTLEEQRQELFFELMYSGKTYTASQMARNFKRLGEDIEPSLVELLYIYYGSVNNYDAEWTMTIEEVVNFISDKVMDDERFSGFIDDKTRGSFEQMTGMMDDGVSRLRGPQHSIAVVIADLPDESPQTYSFVERMEGYCDAQLASEHYSIGESVMFTEMKNGFDDELFLVTVLTVLAIFLIVAITFRSIIVPLILVLTVMTGVYVNVAFSGIGGGTMLYLAYLIVQSILMGATIDYGILFANYYKEKRKSFEIADAVREAYHGSIHTIMTSGLIMVIGPGVMSLLVEDVTISAIVGCLSIGALVAVLLILCVVPGLLAAFDRLVVFQRRRKK